MEKKLVTVPLRDLVPYEKNARRNDATVPDLAKDIQQVGYISPIVVDENNIILAGHTRLRALELNGETEAEVMRVTGLTEDQKRKFRLYDNKLGEKSPGFVISNFEVEHETIGRSKLPRDYNGQRNGAFLGWQRQRGDIGLVRQTL